MVPPKYFLCPVGTTVTEVAFDNYTVRRCVDAEGHFVEPVEIDYDEYVRQENEDTGQAFMSDRNIKIDITPVSWDR